MHANLHSARWLVAGALVLSATAWADNSSTQQAVGPQYDTTHVYVEPGQMDAFVNSLVKTFGGKTTSRVKVDVTPTPSQTWSQLVLTPVGSFSVFDFQTPTPWPFGSERNGFLVKDMDKAVAEARAAGADVIVAPFPDPIGRDAVVQWPGGVNMQLYWHTKAPNYPALASVPENRVYLSPYRVDAFINSFLRFSQGKVVSDKSALNPALTPDREPVREVTLSSTFGVTRVIVTNGHLNWPFGHERTGYGVSDLSQTLSRAQSSGAKVLWQSAENVRPSSAMVRFPGGYIAEIHQQ